MADSIAKLAVIITGDASPLGDATRQAEKHIKDMQSSWSAGLERMRADSDRWAAGMRNLFARQNPFSAFQGLTAGPAGRPNEAWTAGMAKLKEQQDGWAAGLRNLATAQQQANIPMGQMVPLMANYRARADESAHATLRLATAFSAARGNLAAMGGILLTGNMALGLTALGVAAGFAAFKIAAASDALEVASGARAADTWAGQFDRLQAAALSIAQTLGRPLSEALTRETATWARILERVADSIMPDQIRKERELAAGMEKRKKLAEEMAKAEREAAEAASRQFQEAQQRAISAAERIRASLRTPGETVADTIDELNRLFQLGFLNVETYTRGISKARADLLSAQASIEVKARQPAPAITAAERFTTAGQSAVEAARRQSQAQMEIEKAQLAAQKRQEELIKETNRLLRQKTATGPTLAIAGLQ